MAKKTLEFEQIIQVPTHLVYRAFTNASALREWLCDIATINAKSGGRVYLAWNSGYYACGEYIALEKNKEIQFSWYGRNEPASTLVGVKLEESNNGTRLRLTHSGLEDNEVWADTIQQFEEGWQSGLENLACVLECGEDLRFTRRPMLGITVNDFTPEQAKKMGVPVAEGVRIDTVVEGKGAERAGLQADDVLIRMAGVPIQGFQSIPVALSGKQAGDQMEVVFYRGNQLHTTLMTLSSRPIPDIPQKTTELAQMVEKRYQEQQAEMKAFFEDVSEAEADYQPAEGEWSAKGVLAHLIHSERFQHFHLAEIVSGYERWADDFGGNLDAMVRATVSAYPTLRDLLDELWRHQEETVAIIANLPEDFTQYKGSYWRMAFESLEAPYHFQSHLEQMQNCIQAARQSGAIHSKA